MSARSYLAIAGIVWGCLTMICLVIAVSADPYRAFGTPSLSGLTQIKPRIYQQMLIAKTYQLERIKPRTLLLGNSRVEIGFDPGSAVWPAAWKPVFNAGLDGRDIFMASRMLDEGIAVGSVATAIVELDFPDFLTDPVGTDSLVEISNDERRLLVDRDGAKNAFRGIQLWRDRFTATLTIGALSDSFLTFVDQRPSRSVTMTEDGFNPLHEYESDAHNLGYYELFAQKEAAYEVQFRHYPYPNFGQTNRIEGFIGLERILHVARAHRVHLIFFIPPYHEDFLRIIRETSRWKEFEDWKRALVRVIAADNRNYSEGHATRLIDFSGYNVFTMEGVPSKGDTRSRTLWYWEPGHYKASLGNLMLKRLIENSGHFGEILDQESIETALINERRLSAPKAKDKETMMELASPN